MGRAARAGRSGIAFNLVEPDEIPYMIDFHLFISRSLSSKVDPVDNEKKYLDIIGSIFFIKKEDCEIFDTTQKIEKSAPTLMKHTERFCEHYQDPNHSCKFCKTFHE